MCHNAHSTKLGYVVAHSVDVCIEVPFLQAASVRPEIALESRATGKCSADMVHGLKFQHNPAAEISARADRITQSANMISALQSN